MFEHKRLTVLSIAILLSLLFAAVLPLAARADDGAPPEPPAEGQTVDPPSGGDAGAGTTDTTTGAAVTTDAPAVDATAPVAPVVDAAAPAADAASDATQSDESIADVTQALSDANAVLVDQGGNSVPLTSLQAAEALTSNDPWFDAGGGVVVGYSSTGSCAASVTECHTTATPIQAAINDARSGGKTITVEAGTYTEQLSIGKSLSLAGAGAGVTTIKAPATMTADANGQRSIVSITGSGISVDFGGFTVTGPGPAGSGFLDFGIFVGGGATANIHDNTISAVRDPTFSGAQHGVAIQVGRSKFSSVGTATIKNNTITDYQKNGLTVDGTGSSATITGNTVTGHGPTTITAQNGIQISRGATGTISGNTITGNNYTPGTAASTGILLYQAGNNVQVLNNMLGGAGSAANQTNLFVQETNNVTISNNTITDSTLDNVDLYIVNGVTFTNNTVSGSGYDGVWLGSAANVDFDGNKFSNNANGAAAASDPNAGAIHLGTGANPTSITVTSNNSFSGDKNGVSNESNLAGFVDATNNWWGCSGGPGAAGCDTVFGNVTVSPFLTSDPDPDGDFVFNPGDNCPAAANPGQADANGNGIGDACDTAGGGGDGDGGAGHTPGFGPFAPPVNAGTTPLTLTGLPGALPGGQTFVSGLTLNPTIPVTGGTTAGVQLSFDIPAGSAGPFTVLFWNGTAWVEVPSTVVEGKVVVTVTAPGDYVLVSP